jgi:glutathione S-transferase
MVPTLYHCADARSFRALWMLEELELDYRLELLPFPPRWRQPEYLEVNPLGTIPLLVDGDERLTESSAICHYLATTRGDGRFAVAPGELGYGAYLNALHYGESTLTFPQTLVLRYSILEPEEKRQPKVAADYAKWYQGRLVALDSALQASDYVAAGRFTAADVSVGYALLLARTLKLDGENTLAITAYWERLQARPAFQRAKSAQRREKAA